MTTFGEKFLLPTQMVIDLGLKHEGKYFTVDGTNMFYIEYALQNSSGYYVREVIPDED